MFKSEVSADSICSRPLFEGFPLGDPTAVAEEKGLFEEVLGKAGFRVIEINIVPSHNWSTPWVEVLTKFGVLFLSRKERFISIHWNQMKVDGINDLFLAEKVPKGAGYIHARDLKQALEYLSRIYNYLSAGYAQ